MSFVHLTINAILSVFEEFSSAFVASFIHNDRVESCRPFFGDIHEHLQIYLVVVNKYFDFPVSGLHEVEMDFVLLKEGADLVSSDILWILIIAVDDHSCSFVISECEVTTIVCD
jgi:hypothetical protein